MLTSKQAAWVAESERRVRVVAQRLRDLGAAQARPAGLPIVPPFDRAERMWGERNVCRTCGANLRRTEQLAMECRRCRP